MPQKTSIQSSLLNLQISVFISYAREDRLFVNALVEMLEKEAIEVCGDWLLTGGESYKEQLRQLILGADIFISIISPDFLISNGCEEEVDYAAGFNKIIIPIAHRNHGEDAEIYDALREPQWIFIKSINDIVSSSASLIEAIRTDFHLLPQHRELLIAADNWDKNERDGSYLLRKSSLKSAEEWLARVSAIPDASPRPTPLQVDYVLASQTANRRQNHQIFSIYTIVIIIVAALAIYANWQRIQTQTSLNTANENMATSIGIQANRMILQKRRMEALNLLVKSREYPVTPEIVSASLSMNQPLVSLLRTGQIDADFLEWIQSSPDGKSLIGADVNRSLHLYRFDKNETISLPEFESRSIRSVSYTKGDSSWWFAGEEHGLLRSVIQEDSVFFLRNSELEPNAIQWGIDEKYALIGLSSGQLDVIVNDTLPAKITLLNRGFNEVSLDKSGKRAAASNFGLDVYVWETGRWGEIARLRVGQDLMALDEEAAIAHPYVLLSPDNGSKLAVQIEVNEGVMLLLYDVDKKEIITTQLLDDGDSQTGKNLFFSPNGALLIVVDRQNVFAINTVTGVRRWSLPIASPGQGLAVDPQNRFVAVALDLGEFGIFDINDGSQLEQVGAHGQLVVGLDFNSEGNKLFSASQNGLVREWQISEEPHIGYWLDGKRLNNGTEFSDDGTLMAKPILIENFSWAVLYQDLLTDSLNVAEVVSGQRIEAVAFNTDNRYLILGNGAGEIAIWDIKNQSPVLPWKKTFQNKVISIDANRNDLFIASSSTETTIHSLPNGNLLCELRSDSLRIQEAIAAPQHNVFAIQGLSATGQYVSEIRDCKLNRLPPLRDMPNYITYNQDGKLFVIGNDFIRFWDNEEEALSEAIPLSIPISSFREGICRRNDFVIVPSAVNDLLLNLQVIDLNNGTQFVVENIHGRTKYAENNDFILSIGCSQDGKRATTISRYDLLQKWGIRLPENEAQASSQSGMKLVGVTAVPDLPF